MIRITGIIGAWAEGLRTDEALNQWCLDTLGKGLTVFAGFDPKDKPGRKHAPFIVLQPLSDKTGDEIADWSFTVWLIMGIDCGGMQKDQAQLSPPLGAGQALDALPLLDSSMTDLVLDALRKAAPDLALSTIDATYDPGDFPFVVKELDITVTIPRVLGMQLTL